MAVGNFVNENLARPSVPEKHLLSFLVKGSECGRWEHQGSLRAWECFVIVDFICPGLKLVVEADDCSHHQPHRIVQDFFRDLALSKKGYRTLRFDYQEFDADPSLVFARIKKIVDKRRLKRTLPPVEETLNEGTLLKRVRSQTKLEREETFRRATELYELYEKYRWIIKMKPVADFVRNLEKEARRP